LTRTFPTPGTLLTLIVAAADDALAGALADAVAGVLDGVLDGVLAAVPEDDELHAARVAAAPRARPLRSSR
jgi:hypothetical protein